MEIITLEDILNSYERIKKYIYKTPLEKSIFLSNDKTEIYFKWDNRQILHCSKIRGAFSKLTNIKDKSTKIIATSSGNHGMSMAYVSKYLGFKNIDIYVPFNIEDTKEKRILSYNANIKKVGKDYDGAHAAGISASKLENCIYVDPCSDVEVLSGSGSIAIEILEDLDHIDQIFIPLGGGGILTGIASYIKYTKPDIKIIGVMSEKSPAMLLSIEKNEILESYDAKDSICEALIGGVGKIPFNMAKNIIDEMILVDEKYILKAIKHFLYIEKEVVEASAAITLGAFYQYEEKFKNKRNVLVVTGGNINNELFEKI